MATDVMVLIGQTHQKLTVIEQTVKDGELWYLCGWISKDGLWQEKQLPRSKLSFAIEFVGKETLQDAINGAWNIAQENKAKANP